MKTGMRFVLFILIVSMSVTVFADFQPSHNVRSYILMDYDTGTILAESNSNEPYPIASVTKVMTMLICMESLQAGRISMGDVVTVSEYAASMGGSQIYLEPGEQMSVEELLKSVAVGSANDASVALAEHIMGSETAFVDAMNERAKALGMTNTHFVNCNGLDEDNHYSSAADVAAMSRELLKHDAIRPFLGIWMDSVRNGQFGLTNTNKLIRFYNGAIGVKTGSTTNAKYCLSSAASRDGLTIVAVVLGAETTNERFETAKELLNYGFANYKIETLTEANKSFGTANVLKGKTTKVEAVTKNSLKRLIDKQSENATEEKVTLNNVEAPVTKGDIIGKIEFIEKGDTVGEVDLVASEDVKKLNLIDVFGIFLTKWLLK